MIENWADVVADRIVGASPPGKGKLLLLGAADTGKTTLMNALAARFAQTRPVALVDADTGQSHIGPPTTVGWTLLEGSVGLAPPESTERIAELAAKGIAFVGDITPVGHLLQLAAALVLCVEQARQAADVVLIDTPGLATGEAACVLWWTVQRVLRPDRVVAVQRESELAQLLGGLQAGVSIVEIVKAPEELRRKSPEARQQHRRGFFDQYFKDAKVYTLNLRGLAVRTTHDMSPEDAVGRVVGFTDVAGQDVAIGVIERWRRETAMVTIRAPLLDIRRVRCLTVGNARIDTSFGGSG